MKTPIIFAGFMIILLVTGCAREDDLLQQSRVVSDFTSILFKTDGTLNIMQGESESLTIEAVEDILPLIDTEVKDGTLIIQFNGGSRNNLLGRQRINYSLVIKDLTTVVVEGEGMVNINRLNIEHLKVTINGSAIVSASGKVTDQEIIIAGMGHYKAPELASEATKVTNDYGLVTVWATKLLEVRLTSIGKVYYYGNPEINQSVSGGGKLINEGSK